MVKRLLAVLGAAGLIVVAVFVRHAIDDNGPASSASDGSTPTVTEHPVDVWCLEDLRAVCEAAFGPTAARPVKLTIESMRAALARLASANVADDLPDAWVTFAPLPEMGRDAVARAGGPGSDVATNVDLVATTRLVIATRPDRAALMTSVCAPPVAPDWRCLGTVAGRKWSDFGGVESLQNIKPAFGDPTTSATA